VTKGPQVFEGFGLAGLLFVLLGAVMEFSPRGAGALMLFGPLALLCFLFGALFWFVCWLLEVMKFGG
jgi:hypothetical protein